MVNTAKELATAFANGVEKKLPDMQNQLGNPLTDGLKIAGIVAVRISRSVTADFASS
jgi:hypothetical protein